ncbi:MAG: carboxypeptidase regulatory-like domain-containing protein [Vulcanimicrobiota bacterium]
MRKLLWLLLCTQLAWADLHVLVHSTTQASTITGYELVGGARVTLEGEGRRLEATCDANGAHLFDDLPAGTYLVEVRQDGYAPVSRVVKAPGRVALAVSPLSGPAGRVYVAYIPFSDAGMPRNLQSLRARIVNGQDPLGTEANPPLDASRVRSNGEQIFPVNANALTRGRANAFQAHWLCFGPDNRVLYRGGPRHLEVTDTVTHEPLANLPMPGNVTGMTLSPDGRLLLVAVFSGDPGIAVIDTQTQRQVGWLRTQGVPQGVVALPDRLAVVTEGRLEVLGLDGTPLGSVPLGTRSQGACLAGGLVYVANGGNGNVSICDPVNLRLVSQVIVGVNPTRLAATPDGVRVFVTCRGNDRVVVIDTASARVLASTYVGPQPVDIAISPDGTRAYTTCLGDGTIVSLDARTGQAVHTAEALPRATPWGIAVK